MNSYETLLDGIRDLYSQGYTIDLNLKENSIEYYNATYKIFHDEFEIDSYYRFDGMTNPADEVILYAISSKKYQIKGTLVNAYGMYSDAIAEEILNNLKLQKCKNYITHSTQLS